MNKIMSAQEAAKTPKPQKFLSPKVMCINLDLHDIIQLGVSSPESGAVPRFGMISTLYAQSEEVYGYA